MELTQASLEATLIELSGQTISFCPDRVVLKLSQLLRLQRMMPTHGVTVRRASGARRRRVALKSRGSRASYPGYHFRSYP